MLFLLWLTGAMKLDGRKAELFGNVCVFNLQSFIDLQDDSRMTRSSKNKRMISESRECCPLIPTSPSPTRWPKSWRRWLIRSQMFWTLHLLSCRFHPPGSGNNVGVTPGFKDSCSCVTRAAVSPPEVSWRHHKLVRPPVQSPHSWSFCPESRRFSGFRSGPPPSGKLNSELKGLFVLTSDTRIQTEFPIKIMPGGV